MTRFYALYLNPMQGNTEDRCIIAVSDNIATLQKILDENRVPPYQDRDSGVNNRFDGQPTCWNKNFRKGGELEWFNPPEYDYNLGHGIIEIGTKEEYLQKYITKFDTFINEWFRK